MTFKDILTEELSVEITKSLINLQKEKDELNNTIKENPALAPVLEKKVKAIEAELFNIKKALVGHKAAQDLQDKRGIGSTVQAPLKNTVQ